MRSLWSILVIGFALFALASPSFAVVVRSASTPAVQIEAVTAQSVRVEPVSGCAQQGGPRVLPCQPDPGVLIGQAARAVSCSTVSYFVRHDLPGRSVEPGMNLPPPRCG
jgi:hypothetical protein